MALDPFRRRLPSGVTVLAKETRTSPTVTVIAGLDAGSVLDPPDGAGTAALVARVLDRGTTSRSAAAIADDLDGRGASLSVAASRHQIVVSATALAEDFDVTLDLVADILRQPSFPPREVETRRADLVTALLEDEDDPACRAANRLRALLYPAHPYGRPSGGTVQSVQALTRERLLAYHAAWFAPAGLIISVAGDVDLSRVLDGCARAFEGWTTVLAERPALPPIVAPTVRRLDVVPMPSKAQTEVAYGMVGIGRHDPEYYAALVMNNAFGQYALGGRLGDSIRERQGMAYHISSALDASVGAGPLAVRAGVAPSNVERTIASIDAEIEAVRRGGFTSKEIDESKQYLVGALPRQLETNAAIAGFLLSAEYFGLGLDFDARLPGLIDAVGMAQADEAARRLLDPARATVVVVGPWEGPGA